MERQKHSGQQIALQIRSEVFLAAVLLHVPVIGIAGVCPVFDPNPTLRINKSLFPFPGTVRDCGFLDDPLSLFVRVELGKERHAAASG
jgi:hypothetical protein